MRIDGNIELAKIVEELKVDLPRLVAATSIWASPEVCIKFKDKTGSCIRYPTVRRKKAGESRGKKDDGSILDDNTYANNAIKWAVGIKRKNIENYDVCHIWPRTCYDERCHTAIPNLVLIPSALASLSDESEDVQAALRYRSYELYKWLPEGENPPSQPRKYPKSWREPEKDGNPRITPKALEIAECEALLEAELETHVEQEEKEIEKVRSRLPKWIRKPEHINSKIFTTFMKLLPPNGNESVSLKKLRKACASLTTFDTNFAQMKNIAERNHGKIFDVDGDEVCLWPPVAKFAKRLWSDANKPVQVISDSSDKRPQDRILGHFVLGD